MSNTNRVHLNTEREKTGNGNSIKAIVKKKKRTKCVCVCVCVGVRKRERERGEERDGECVCLMRGEKETRVKLNKGWLNNLRLAPPTTPSMERTDGKRMTTKILRKCQKSFCCALHT